MFFIIICVRVYCLCSRARDGGSTAADSLLCSARLVQSSSDRFNVNVSFSKNWEHLQNKWVGTGHPDLPKWEWAVNHHRDSLASVRCCRCCCCHARDSRLTHTSCAYTASTWATAT